MRGVVIDTETTGFGKDDKIVSITLLEFFNDTIEGIYTSYVNPDKPISGDATKVNGITDEMVKGFPRFYEILPDVMRIIKNKFLYSYNAPFDKRFLKYEGIATPGIYDVLKPCKEQFRLETYSLLDVASYLGFHNLQPHSSISDTLLCFKIVRALANRGVKWQS